jgi:hypothetical protein
MCIQHLMVMYLHGLHEGDFESHHRGSQTPNKAVNVIGPPKLGWTEGARAGVGNGLWMNGSIFRMMMCAALVVALSVGYRPLLMRSLLEAGVLEMERGLLLFPRGPTSECLSLSQVLFVATASSDFSLLGGSCHAPSRARCRPRACWMQ